MRRLFAAPEGPSGRRLYVKAEDFPSPNPPRSRITFHQEEAALESKLDYVPASQRKEGEPVLQAPAEEKSPALLVNFNWPLTSIGEPAFVRDSPKEFVVPGKPKPIIFKACGAVYGNPPASDLLPQEELNPEFLERYSHQSRHIMDLHGFYSDEPHASGYGPLIRRPNCKLGIG